MTATRNQRHLESAGRVQSFQGQGFEQILEARSRLPDRTFVFDIFANIVKPIGTGAGRFPGGE